MLKTINLSAITGGASTSIIRNFPELQKELERDPGLEATIYQLMGNEKISNIVADPAKLNAFIGLLDQMEPDFMGSLPFIRNDFNR